MSVNARLSVALVAAFLLVAGLVAGLSRSGDGAVATAAGQTTAGAPVVREDSHRLSTAADGRVTLVEFLDFECESCRAAYPLIEQLRKDYAGRVTFVARYFPLPSHANAQNAALAVEAAAQQGRFEQMYQQMYQTQSEWGEQRTSEADLFRTFAANLGLDLAAYDRAVADPATERRVQRDLDDGIALGVRGTPTFFLNGQRVEPRAEQQFRAMLDDALQQ